MRYPEGHKQEVRAKIVAQASRALRRSGLDAVSIPRLMKLAGLTHGGFYAHFRGRDELLAEAVKHAAADTATRVFEPAPTLDAALDTYLSPEHVAAPELGCVVAALGTDGPRQAAPVRKAFAQAARGLVERVQRKLDPGARGLSDEALATTATMVGAVVLARLLDDPALRARLLAASHPR